MSPEPFYRPIYKKRIALNPSLNLALKRGELAGKSALIWGKGKSAMAAERLLIEKKMKVEFFVNDPEEKVSFLPWEKKQFDLIIKSPGVDPRQDLSASLPLDRTIDETELAYHALAPRRPKIIAITGTNGKTTTAAYTAKLAELLYGVEDVFLGGNIGRPLSELYFLNSSLAVLELSSFQIEFLSEFRADLAAIINLSPSHEERYDSLDDYYRAKLKLFCAPGAGACLLDEKAKKNCLHLLNSFELLEGVHYRVLEKGTKQISLYSPKKKLSSCNERNLHYALQILEALYGAPTLSPALRVEDLPKFPHRQELIFSSENLKVINDSKSTNFQSTEEALKEAKREYPKAEIVLILAGKERNKERKKEAEMIPPLGLQNLLQSVRVLYWGEDLPAVLKPFKGIKWHKDLFPSLNAIVAKKTSAELVILFSPAFPSFDKFANYERRGEYFSEQILLLAKERAL